MKNALRNNKGFTLVEMLITMIIISMVVSLIFGIIGNPVKDASIRQAATKVADDLRSCDDAGGGFLVDKTIYATCFLSTEPGGVAATALVDQGYLKTRPVPPSQGVATPGTDIYKFDLTYTAWKTVAADTAVKLTNVTDNVCMKINELYAGAAAGAAIPAAISGTLDIQCFGPGGGANTVVKPIYIN